MCNPVGQYSLCGAKPRSTLYIVCVFGFEWRVILHVSYVLSFLPARRYASAGNRGRKVSVCLSVRPSVTRRYCAKTKKASVMIFSPPGSPMILVFWRQILSQNSKGQTRRGILTMQARQHHAVAGGEVYNAPCAWCPAAKNGVSKGETFS